MNIYLAGNATSQTDLEKFEKVLRLIERTGSTLTQNWLEPARKRIENGGELGDWEAFVTESIAAIKRADVVIAEVSNQSFQAGFQIAAALEFRKPVLVLSSEAIEDSYLNQYQDTFVTFAHYTSDMALARAVSDFLQQNTIHTKDLRFNMLFDAKIYNFLEERSQETGISRSDIIRDLIRKKIERK